MVIEALEDAAGVSPPLPPLLLEHPAATSATVAVIATAPARLETLISKASSCTSTGLSCGPAIATGR